MENLELLKKIEEPSNYLKGTFYSKNSPLRNLKLSVPSEAILSAQDDAWNLYTGALRNFVAGGVNWPNLQLVAPVQLQEKLNWDDPDFGDFYFHKITSDLINGLGSTYSKTDKSFSERFGAFISDVYRPPIDTNAQVEMIKAETQLTTDEQRHNSLLDNLNLEWVAFDTRQRNSLPPYLWKSFDNWWTENAASQVQRSQEIVLSYFMNYESWVQKTFQGGETLAGILNNYFDPRNKITVKIPQNTGGSLYGGQKSILPYQISEDYPSWLKAARLGQLGRTTLQIKHDSHSSNVSQSDIAGGAGIFCGFFGAFAVGQRKTLQIDTSSEKFSLSFDAVFKTFEIIPGNWCNTAAFDLYRNGPFYPNSAMGNLATQNALFGPNGFLSFKPIRAIVAYNPRLSITLDRDSYHYFHQETSGFGGFCIGPFIVGGGSYYDSKTTISSDDDNFTFGFEIKDYAILIAFDSQEI